MGRKIPQKEFATPQMPITEVLKEEVLQITQGGTVTSLHCPWTPANAKSSLNTKIRKEVSGPLKILGNQAARRFTDKNGSEIAGFDPKNHRISTKVEVKTLMPVKTRQTYFPDVKGTGIAKRKDDGRSLPVSQNRVSEIRSSDPSDPDLITATTLEHVRTGLLTKATDVIPGKNKFQIDQREIQMDMSGHVELGKRMDYPGEHLPRPIRSQRPPETGVRPPHYMNRAEAYKFSNNPNALKIGPGNESRAVFNVPLTHDGPSLVAQLQEPPAAVDRLTFPGQFGNQTNPGGHPVNYQPKPLNNPRPHDPHAQRPYSDAFGGPQPFQPMSKYNDPTIRDLRDSRFPPINRIPRGLDHRPSYGYPMKAAATKREEVKIEGFFSDDEAVADDKKPSDLTDASKGYDDRKSQKEEDELLSLLGRKKNDKLKRHK
jgi:hypothetical protein